MNNQVARGKPSALSHLSGSMFGTPHAVLPTPSTGSWGSLGLRRCFPAPGTRPSVRTATTIREFFEEDTDVTVLRSEFGEHSCLEAQHPVGGAFWKPKGKPQLPTFLGIPHFERYPFVLVQSTCYIYHIPLRLGVQNLRRAERPGCLARSSSGPTVTGWQ